MNPLPVLSTYRLQLRGTDSGFGFTFADAENLLDYLDGLGVTHLYLSPILTAVHGSSHGYDVTDPATVSAELGGPQGFARLSAAARSRGMGLIVDIVPNHMSVARPEQNPWWWDVLRHGRASAYAHFFDIDWALTQGRIVLPVLDARTGLGGLTVHGEVLRVGSLTLPVAPGSSAGRPAQVLDRQHYRLVDWQSGQCGYRRFLSVNSLAALRQEDDSVFAATHVEVARWFAEGLVDGVRVDHLDGLADPVGYLRRLRELTGPDAWIVVEKLLAADETVDPALPVAGTTGYDALRLLDGVFVDPQGEASLTALAAPTRSTSPAELTALAAKRDQAAELHRLRCCISAAPGSASSVDDELLERALVALVARNPGYRCDYPALQGRLDTAVSEAAAAEPELTAALGLIATALAGGGEPAVRLAQLCTAAYAGGIEGRLFHRDARLVALNELGCDPGGFAVSTTEFHEGMTDRAQRHPRAMTALSTHDTKRGEDVRARIAVLSQLPDRWADCITRWEAMAPAPDTATGLFLWQNIFGVWPAAGVVTDALRARLHDYARKAVREAGLHTGWARQDSEFEAAVERWLDTVFDGPVAAELTALVRERHPHADCDALGAKLLSLTVPGVPDVYQGTELWEDSLTDPDNRRPVDFGVRRGELAVLQHPKLRVVHAALQLRRRRPQTFAGGYRPLPATGAATEHLLAFVRGDDVLVAVSRHTVRLAETGWGDTALPLPAGNWTDQLTGTVWAGSPTAATLFADWPTVLLERTGE